MDIERDRRIFGNLGCRECVLDKVDEALKLVSHALYVLDGKGVEPIARSTRVRSLSYCGADFLQGRAMFAVN